MNGGDECQICNGTGKHKLPESGIDVSIRSQYGSKSACPSGLHEGTYWSYPVTSVVCTCMKQPTSRVKLLYARTGDDVIIESATGDRPSLLGQWYRFCNYDCGCYWINMPEIIEHECYACMNGFYPCAEHGIGEKHSYCNHTSDDENHKWHYTRTR